MGGRVRPPPAALSLDVTPTSRALPWTLKLLGLGLCGTSYTIVPSWQEQIVTLARKALHIPYLGGEPMAHPHLLVRTTTVVNGEYQH